MGWEDRPYYRDRSGPYSGPLMWLVSGSVPMFTAFGIRVRAHASLLIFIICVLIFDHIDNIYTLQARALSMAILVGIVILHEFGHCFAARWVGGSANDILLSPLGGLAYASPPHRPGATFITVAAGPLVNVLICIVCGVAIYFLTPTASMRLYLDHPWHVIPPLNPFSPSMNPYVAHLLPGDAAFYFYWVYTVSYFLLLFNLLPIYPLDGAQMVQAAIWPSVGHHRSMMIATTTGMIGSVFLAMFGVLTGAWFLAILAGFLFFTCYQQRQQLKENAPEAWADSSTVDYTASIYGRPEKPRRRRINRRAINRARKIAHQEAVERERIDSILAKVSAHGMHSLTWGERRALRKATERQRKRDLELSKLF
jgi:Zn-dependent protease